MREHIQHIFVEKAVRSTAMVERVLAAYPDATLELHTKSGRCDHLKAARVVGGRPSSTRDRVRAVSRPVVSARKTASLGGV
jgi:hypothetical protein